jgi:hypothetical protein
MTSPEHLCAHECREDQPDDAARASAAIATPAELRAEANLLAALPTLLGESPAPAPLSLSEQLLAATSASGGDTGLPDSALARFRRKRAAGNAVSPAGTTETFPSPRDKGPGSASNDGRSVVGGASAAGNPQSTRALEIVIQLHPDTILLGASIGSVQYNARRFEDTCKKDDLILSVKKARQKSEVAERVAISKLENASTPEQIACIRADVLTLQKAKVILPKAWVKAYLKALTGWSFPTDLDMVCYLLGSFVVDVENDQGRRSRAISAPRSTRTTRGSVP